MTETRTPAQRKANKAQREKRHEDKATVIEHYGNRCRCCYEWRKSMLDIHHKVDSISPHHNDIRGGRFYTWIIDHDFPDDLEVLCANCHASIHRNGGVCEHQTEREMVSIVYKMGDEGAVEIARIQHDEITGEGAKMVRRALREQGWPVIPAWRILWGTYLWASMPMTEEEVAALDKANEELNF
jgi:hypothetical protein